MKPKTNLYFIALLPPEDLIHQIEMARLRLAKQFKCREALKLVPGISLQIPFQQLPFREEIMIEKLKEFAQLQYPMMVKLNGYGAFPEHTVFIKARPSASLKLLHRQLGKFLKMELNFSDDMIGHNVFRPHITMATKDIKSKFRKIFNEYKSGRFEADFMASSMYLMKHNYSHWEVLEELVFKGVGYTMDLFRDNNHLTVRDLLLAR
ncbi:MAG: 2'-5' RNA ligase family protein [Cytophagales bacterium]|nr:2'-5' RNA ligase family protein [Cytophagales bacterium]